MFTTSYQKAIEALKLAHLQDPKQVQLGTKEVPSEWLYTQRLVACLGQTYPDATEALSIAANCQHLNRWEIKRSDYPEGRAGYYQWRNFLSDYQFNKTKEILQESGYDEEFISRVGAILKKLNIKSVPDAQRLEDVVCLVFLQFYMNDFMHGKSESQLIQIVQKTWGKMSDVGHHAALKLDLPESTGRIVKLALA